MKRFLILIAALALIAALIPAALADTAGLPAEISDYFSKPSFAGMTVLSAADGSGIGGGDACYAVLIRTAQKENVLYMFGRSKDGQAWEYRYSTSSAVPRTSHAMEVGISLSGNEWPTDESYNTPHLSILQIDEDNEYPELCVTFELTKGKWLLHRIWSYTGYDSMLIREGRISYYRDLESDRIAGTAEGSFQRDLRYVSLAAIPKTLAEARAKLTVAPDLPPSDALQVVPVTFSGKKKYEVYSAPDRTSLRGAKGKAMVSTNSWIQVFGTDGDWVLIQYSIDASHYRFGYITVRSLPKNADVPELAFGPVDAWTLRAVALTDDPLYSQSSLINLPEGTHLTWLATLGEWAYVEYDNGDWARGFVPVADVTVTQELDMGNHPADSGEVVYGGTAFLRHDGGLEFELTLAPDGPLAGKNVPQIRVTDTYSADVLAVLSPDSAGVYYGGCSLGGDVSSVTLTAVDEAGAAYPETVRLEW